MKRKTLLIAVLMFVFVLCLGFAGCGCTHSNLIRHQATAASCTKDGTTEYWQCANCDKCFADRQAKQELSSSNTIIKAKGHSWGEWKLSVPSTCSSKGSETRTCSVCRQKETRSIPKLHHPEVTLVAVEPTCTTTGRTESKVCSVCGEVLVAQQTIAAFGHNWQWVVDQEPTQTEQGFKHEECTRCKEKRNENTPIDPTMHTHSLTKVDATNPTCTQTGNKEYWKCSGCGKYFADQNGETELTASRVVVAALGHTEVVTPAVEPSCAQPGLTEGKTCSVCGVILAEQQPVAEKGHNWEVLDITPATCTENGLFTTWCSVCKLLQKKSLAATGHNYDESGVCVNCGYVLVTPPSHTHNYTETVVDSTCTEIGYTLYTCSCGATRRNNIVEPLGHAFDNGTVTTAATCTTAGENTFRCTRCSAYFTEVISASHTWQERVVKPATCTQEGETERTCSSCGVTQTIVVAASHTFGEKIIEVAATCKTSGSGHHVCTLCGIEESFEIAAIGHNYVNGVCSNCSEHFSNNIVTNPDAHVLYGMYFKVDETISAYGPLKVDEYGVYLYVNEGAQIDKVAVYLTQDGTMWRRTIACTGTNITTAIYVPYLSYGAEIRYTGFSSPCINTFTLTQGSDGIWRYSDYALIGANLSDSHGNMLLSLFDIAQASSATRIFAHLDEMKAWLGSGAHTHTLAKISALEATCTTAGNKEYWQCSDCGRYFADQQGKTETTLNSIVVAAKGHTDADKNCVCDSCNAQIAHKEEILAAVEPTCTRVGLTEGKKCSVCGTILVAQQELPLVYHRYADGTEITPEERAKIHAFDKNNNPRGLVLISGTIFDCNTVITDDMSKNGGVICPSCGQFIALYLSAPHSFQYKLNEVGTSPTSYTLQGTCTVCGKTAWDKPIATKDVTCAEVPSTCKVQGTKTYTVTDFDGNVYEIVEKLPRAFHRDADGNEIDISKYTAETPYKWTLGEEQTENLKLFEGTVLECGEVFNVGFCCLDCHEIVTFKAILEHNFVNGVCTHCGATDGQTPVGSEGLTYELNYDGTAYTVTHIGTCTDTEIVIPATYNGKPVTALGEYAFYGDGSVNLTSIFIPQSITSIPSSAFNNNVLQSITVENGNHVYRSEGNCLIETASQTVLLGLANSTIPNNVTKIGTNAFAGCEKLTSITIPESVTIIGDYAFYNCKALTSLIIPQNVKEIWDMAFSGCSGLKNLVISNGVQTIKRWAFAWCSELTSINIPQSVTVVDEVFVNCSGLTSVTIPSHITSMNGAFSHCSGLTDVTLANGITSIGNQTFLGCSKLTNITIPNSVTQIGNSAFYECTGLKSITLPNSVETVGSELFFKCSSLTTVNIPTSVSQISRGMFSRCTALTEISIPNGVTEIGQEAFSGCSGLTNLPLSESVTKIGNAAFMDCSGLVNITIPQNITTIGNSAFNHCTNLKSVSIQNGVTSIGGSAFSDCTSLTSINIPNSVTTFGTYTFSGCTSLTNITIPDSVTSMGKNVFRGCSKLTINCETTSLPSGWDSAWNPDNLPVNWGYNA